MDETALPTVTESDRLELLDGPPESGNPVALYLDPLAESSVRVQRRGLETASAFLTGGIAAPERTPWWKLTYRGARELRNALADVYAPKTANRIMSAVRKVLREAWGLGLLSGQKRDRLNKALETISEDRDEVPGRRLQGPELEALIEACHADSNRPAGLRDAAIIAVLARAGLRRKEAADLKVRDWDPEAPHREEGVGEIRAEDRKGGVSDAIPVANGAKRHINRWIEARGREPGALFCKVRRGGHIDPERGPMTARGISYRLEVRAAEAGLEHFSAHDLRRTFISDVLDAGVDLSTASRMAGHSNPRQTARYDRRGREAEDEAAEKLAL